MWQKGDILVRDKISSDMSKGIIVIITGEKRICVGSCLRRHSRQHNTHTPLINPQFYSFLCNIYDIPKPQRKNLISMLGKDVQTRNYAVDILKNINENTTK